MIPVCQDCGMSHAPDDTAACIEGHGDDPYPLIDRLDQGWLTTEGLTTDRAAGSE